MPHHRAETKANIPVFLLHSLSRAMSDLGLDTARLTVGLGFTLDDLTDPSFRISFRQGREMIRRALRLADGHALGLETGRRETIGSIGMVGYAMATCETLGEAIELAISLHRETGSMLDFSIEEIDELTVLRADIRYPDPAIQVFLFEEAFSSFTQIARDLLGVDHSPTRIDFPCPEPAQPETYARVFDCELRFNQMAGRFCYPAAWNTRLLATTDKLNHRLIRGFLAQNLTRGDADIIETVSRLLRQQLDAPPSIGTLAAHLHLSERTLRRRLSEAGITFSALLDRLRSEKAQELLANPNISIERIAHAVGFADAQAFHRAFRRWTGQTPGTVRRNILAAWPERS